MRLDAIAITSSNLRESVKFYQLLGFSFAEFGENEKHIEPITQNGEVRLMIDTKDLMEQLNGVVPVPPNHATCAMLCDSPNEVNEVTQKIKDAGYKIVHEPYDAFWGQRYATVKDPDGYMIDLFAAL